MGSTPVGISASRGAAVLGLSEYQTQFEVWQLLCEARDPGFNARRGLVLPPPPDSPPLRWGKAFEDAIVELAQEATGEKISDRERFFHTDGGAAYDLNLGHPAAYFEHAPPITCHIDGAYSIARLHEGKTTFERAFWKKWGKPGTDKVPGTYQVQSQHCLGCTGASEEIISLLVLPRSQEELEDMGWRVLPPATPGCPYRIDHEDHQLIDPMLWARVLADMGYFYQYRLEAKPSLIKMLFDGYRHFWDHHVLAGVEPEISTYADIKRAFPEPVGTIVCTPAMERMLEERKGINEEIGKSGCLAKRAEQIKVQFLARARLMDKDIDDASREKTVFVSANGGKKLAQWDGKTFR